MSRPYIDTYENQNGDIVLVYIPEVKPMTQVEPEHIALDPEHVEEIIEALKQEIQE